MKKNLIRTYGIFMPIMFDSGVKSEGGVTVVEDENPELKAIGEIATQIGEFKSQLGDKANEAEFKKVQDELQKLKDGLTTMTSKQVLDSMEKINKQNASILKQIEELQEESAQAKEVTGKKGKVRRMFATEDVKKFISDTFKDGEKTQTPASIELNMKAAEDFGSPQFFDGGPDTDTTAFTGRFIDPELYKIRHKRNMILDHFMIMTIGVPSLVYLQKEEIGDSASISGDPGSAEWILSGAPKPKRSFRVSSSKVDAKKVAIFGSVDDELLMDVASLENWIREDFVEQMREAINDGLLNNNPAVNPEAPLGLKVNAIQYSTTPAFADSFEDPTYIDALIAIFALMAYNREDAGMAFVSSDVWYRIHALKDTMERYQNNNLIYTNNLGQLFIAGVRIEWVDQEDVASTHVIVIGRDLGFKIKAYGSMVFERGLNGEDFREDKTSFRGYQRFLSYIPSNRENSVLYDTWENIFAGIAAPVSA
jgi:HK97 family phage major capsid protein